MFRIPAWQFSADERSLFREFIFTDSATALTFINQVGELAEAEDRHPDIHWWRNTVKLVLPLHATDGASEKNDVLMEKIDQLY